MSDAAVWCSARPTAREVRRGGMEVAIFRAGVEMTLEMLFDSDGAGGYARYFGIYDGGSDAS